MNGSKKKSNVDKGFTSPLRQDRIPGIDSSPWKNDQLSLKIQTEFSSTICMKRGLSSNTHVGLMPNLYYTFPVVC